LPSNFHYLPGIDASLKLRRLVVSNTFPLLERNNLLFMPAIDLFYMPEGEPILPGVVTTADPTASMNDCWLVIL
jgi:hypothetical protein